MDSLCRKPFFVDGSLGRKQEITVSTEAKYDRQSLQEAKISGLVYTLCCRALLHVVCWIAGPFWSDLLVS